MSVLSTPAPIAPELATSARPQYMPALTGIRAIAAYMVCFFHYNPLEHVAHTTGWRQIAFDFFNELHIGVTIFFVLSGFLICYRYYETAATITWPWFKRYFRNRFARIYPMYFLITLVAFALIEWRPTQYELVQIYSQKSAAERLGILLLNITMLKGFFSDYLFTGVSQGWSLTVEECFYACAPFFIIGFRRSRWFFIVLPVATLLTAFGLWQTLGKLHFHGLFGSPLFILNFTFFGRCLEFFMGMALAVYVLRQRRYHAGSLPNRRGPWLTASSVGLFAAATILMAIIHRYPSLTQLANAADFHGNSKDSYVGVFINNALLPLFISMLFYGLLTERTWLRTLLSTKTFDLLGKSSYIFYLIHIGVLNVLIRTYVAHNSIIQFIVLNILSIALYKFVESPLHQWLKPR